MVRAPGRVTYIPPLNGFETRHGLMTMECLSLIWVKYKRDLRYVNCCKCQLVSVLRVRIKILLLKNFKVPHGLNLSI